MQHSVSYYYKVLSTQRTHSCGVRLVYVIRRMEVWSQKWRLHLYKKYKICQQKGLFSVLFILLTTLKSFNQPPECSLYSKIAFTKLLRDVHNTNLRLINAYL